MMGRFILGGWRPIVVRYTVRYRVSGSVKCVLYRYSYEYFISTEKKMN